MNKKGESLFSVSADANIGVSEDGRVCIEATNKQVAFMNKTGNIAIQTDYPCGNAFSEGIANTWTDSSTQYIDTTGAVIASFPTAGNGDFHDGLAAVSINDTSFYIDKTGKPVIQKLNTQYIYGDFHEERAKAYDNKTGNEGFIDLKGNIVIPVKYRWSKDFSEGLAAVFDKGSWGFIDKNGEIKIEPIFTDVIKGFKNGLCLVEKDNRWGYIDRQGKFIWQEEGDIPYKKIDLTHWKLDTLNINKSLEATCFEVYKNTPQLAQETLPAGLSLKVDTTDITVFENKYRAYKLKLSNNTTDTLEILANNGSLNITQQAIGMTLRHPNLFSRAVIRTSTYPPDIISYSLPYFLKVHSKPNSVLFSKYQNSKKPI